MDAVLFFSFFFLGTCDLSRGFGVLILPTLPFRCAGKSTLLLAMLGEIKPSTGVITREGRIGYASQESWIISESVKENILFGQPLEQV